VTSPLLFAPNGHTIAVATSNGIVLSQIGGGRPLVRIPDSAGSDQLAFSADGGNLAYTTTRHVHIYDMTTGGDRSFLIPAAGSPTFPNQLAWRGDRIVCSDLHAAGVAARPERDGNARVRLAVREYPIDLEPSRPARLRERSHTP
jgi:hypothetical protein